MLGMRRLVVPLSRFELYLQSFLRASGTPSRGKDVLVKPSVTLVNISRFGVF